MYDMVIIGSGPAGLAAAIYAKRAGLESLTIEKNPMSGGQVLNTYEVDNYPGIPGISGFELGMKFREHADKLGCKFQEAVVQSLRQEQEEDQEVFVLNTDQGEIRTRSVIAATGATHAKLGIPGEEELSGMGVSYCATCDGAFFRDKTVAVVGGGDVAAEDAIFLSRICKKVYLIHRRDALRAAAVLQQEVKAISNVEILWNTIPKEIQGEDQVETLLLENVNTGENSSLPVDGVFIAVGIIPESGLFQSMVNCDEKGYVLAGEDCVTQMPGFFAAGDVRSKRLRQVITAAADGANAVASVQEYLMNKNNFTLK